MLIAESRPPSGAPWAGTGCPVCRHPLAAACRCPTPSLDGCGCVLRCDDCSHRFRARPETALLEGSLYDAAYHTQRKTEGTSGFAQKRRTFALHVEILRGACPVLAGRRLLDVGCATGDFLAVVRQHGVLGHGVELSPYAALRARARDLPVVCGRIDDATGGPFDLLHASHVLEHVPDPLAFAERAFALLAPGGLALIEVPNEFDDALTSLRRAVGRDDGRRPGSPHLHFFSAGSLRRLLALAGFLEESFCTYSHGRLPDEGMSLGARLRWITAANGLLRVGDAIGRGRNLVMLARRPVS